MYKEQETKQQKTNKNISAQEFIGNHFIFENQKMTLLA